MSDMGRFYIAGCFADELIVEREKNRIEKRAGGPAHFISGVLGELGDEFEVAPGKRAICEIHVGREGEIGRVSEHVKMSPSPISAQVVLASPIEGEMDLDGIKGDFSEIYADAQGFVRAPGEFGGKRKWELKNFEKVKVLKASSSELNYIPPELLSHVRGNGVLILSKDNGELTLSEKGVETKYRISDGPISYKPGLRDAFFAAFSSEYAKTRDARRAMEFAVHYARKFVVRARE
jgi:hypothetical protein